MNIEFENLTYSVRRGWKHVEQKTLLHGINGCFRSGELSAIMGPSGAGKSTLLNVLSGYRTCGSKGQIKVNGKSMDKRTFHHASRYITQEDRLPQMLTTKESMTVAANLKLPSSTTHKQKEFLIYDILSVLGLQDCTDTYTECLSGGQTKRLSIALELINNPLVFFLDEPTSGLDNVSTMQCLRILRVLAQQGRTIVCTIHQPSASIFQMFDHVYVLGKGRCVYQGATQQLVPYLSSVGFNCPINYNPADYVIEVVDADDKNVIILSKALENGKISHTTSKQLADQVQKFQKESENENSTLIGSDYCEKCSVNQTTCTCRDMTRQSSSLSTAGCLFADYRRFGISKQSTSYPVNGWQQFLILISRMFKQIERNKVALRIQFFHHLLCGLIVGCVFFNTANDGYQMFNHMKFCVGYVLFHTYTNIMVPVLTFPTEVKLLKKEFFNGWYGLAPYYAALMLSKLPGQILFGMIFTVLIYFMSGLPADFVRFSFFSLSGILVIFVSDAIGHAIGSIFNVTNGSAVGPMVVAPFLGLAVYGFDFARDISWFTYALMKLSFMRNGVVATVLALFGYDRQPLDCYTVYCHFRDPKKVLHFVYMEDQSIWNEFSSLFILLLVFRTISFVALRLRLVGK